MYKVLLNFNLNLILKSKAHEPNHASNCFHYLLFIILVCLNDRLWKR